MESLNPGEKYIFRFFNTVPKGYKGDTVSTVDLASPIMNNDLDDYNNKKIYGYKIGDLLNEPSTRVRRPSYYYDFTSDITVPHKGWSVIGLADPMYSMYTLLHHRARLEDPRFYGIIKGDKKNELLIEPALKRLPIDILQRIFDTHKKIYLDKDEVSKLNDLNIRGISLEDRDSLMSALNEFMNTDKVKINVPSIFYDNADIINKRYDYYTGKNALFTNKYNDGEDKSKSLIHNSNNKYGLFNDYDNLLRKLYNFTKWMKKYDNYPEEYRPHLWVASTPVDSIYTADDYMSGLNRAQSDFPEELKVRKIRLLKDMYKNPQFRDNFMREVEDWYKDWDTLTKASIAEQYFNMQHPENISINEESFYNDDEAALNKHARDIISEHFEIDPTNIASDELCKVVWKDISNWHNMRNSQHNIVKGLSGGDNKWR